MPAARFQQPVLLQVLALLLLLSSAPALAVSLQQLDAAAEAVTAAATAAAAAATAGGGSSDAGGSTAATAAATAAAGTPPECPAWFADYERFHAATRGQPGAKYLVHQVPDHRTGKSGGLGDRLRGMLYALRLAQSTRRVLLFTWARPVELSAMLVPGGPLLNWTLDGIEGYNPDAPAGRSFRFMNGQHDADVLGGKLQALDDEFITVQTNIRMDAACPPGCPELNSMDRSTACVWSRLFRPADEVLAVADAELARAYNSSAPRYVAIHLRLGGMTGEQEHERGAGPLKNFAGAVRCANMLAAERNLTAPLMLITDNHHLRAFVRGGHLPNIVTPEAQPLHLDQTLHMDRNVAAHRSTVVDLVLLGRGECLVSSPGYRHAGPSGFSHHGWLYGGGKPCHIDFRKCI